MRKNLFLFCASGTFALFAITACEKSEYDFAVENSAQVENVCVADIWDNIGGEYSGNFTSSEIRKISANMTDLGERSIAVDFGLVKLKNSLPKTNLKFDTVFAKKQSDGTYTFSGETTIVINDYIVPGTVFEFEAALTGHSDANGKLSFEIYSPEHSLSASFIGTK